MGFVLESVVLDFILALCIDLEKRVRLGLVGSVGWHCLMTDLWVKAAMLL